MRVQCQDHARHTFPSHCLSAGVATAPSRSMTATTCAAQLCRQRATRSRPCLRSCAHLAGVRSPRLRGRLTPSTHARLSLPLPVGCPSASGCRQLWSAGSGVLWRRRAASSEYPRHNSEGIQRSCMSSRVVPALRSSLSPPVLRRAACRPSGRRRLSPCRSLGH